MDNNNSVEFGHASLVISILTGIISWMGTIDVAEFIKSISAVVSIAAGIMAIRYYYFATIKAKK